MVLSDEIVHEEIDDVQRKIHRFDDGAGVAAHLLQLTDTLAKVGQIVVAKCKLQSKLQHLDSETTLNLLHVKILTQRA